MQHLRSLDEKMDYAIDVDVPDENIVSRMSAEEPAPDVVRPTTSYTIRPRRVNAVKYAVKN